MSCRVVRTGSICHGSIASVTTTPAYLATYVAASTACIVGSSLVREGHGRIAQRAEALQRQSPDQGQRLERRLERPRAGVEHQLLDAGGGELGRQLGKVFQLLGADGQRAVGLLGDLGGGFGLGRIGDVQQRPLAGQGRGRLLQVGRLGRDQQAGQARLFGGQLGGLLETWPRRPTRCTTATRFDA